MLKRLSLVFVLAVAIGLVPQAAWAQHKKVEVTPLIGFKWGNTLNVPELGTDFKLESSESFGLTIDFAVNEHFQIETLYSYQKSDLTARSVVVPAPTDMDLAASKIQYFHAGGLFTLNPYNRKVNWFLLGTLGATSFSSDDPRADSTTRFSVGFGGGAKIWISDAVGLRLQARGFSTPTNLAQLGWICGYYGCGTVVTNQWYWQGEISAGLIFGFGS